MGCPMLSSARYAIIRERTHDPMLKYWQESTLHYLRQKVRKQCLKSQSGFVDIRSNPSVTTSAFGADEILDTACDRQIIGNSVSRREAGDGRRCAGEECLVRGR